MTFAEAKNALAHLYAERERTEVLTRLAEELTGVSRTVFLCDRDKIIEGCQAEFDDAARRLAAGEPLQYIVGRETFWGRAFLVTPDVLIPRPETQDLVAWVVEDRLARNFADLATGSGCIGVSLALDVPHGRCLALDLSDAALAVARANAREWNADVTFVKGDLLDDRCADTLALAVRQRFGDEPVVVVSNPPYVTESEKRDMSPVVLEHEPGMALFVPDDNPLLFYDAIARLARRLSRLAALYVEINERYGEATQRLFRSLGFDEVILRYDRFDRPRMIRARRVTSLEN